MERNVERKTLSFGKGMTNVPSDLLSDDTELAESNGFIYRDGEMKPVQEAIYIGNVGKSEKIMFVHKGADYENIITWSDGILYWYILDTGDSVVVPDNNNELTDISGEELYDLKSVGNTLIAATSDGLYYFLYKGGKYIDLGNNLPEPEFIPYMKDVPSDYRQEQIYAKLGEIVEERTVIGFKSKTTGEFLGWYDQNLIYPPDDAEEYLSAKNCLVPQNTKVQDYLNAVQGAVSKAINYAHSKNWFCFPFFIRFALKLYDGSYARISNPIICYPTISRNLEMVGDFSTKNYNVKVSHAELEYTAKIPNINLWKDIVKELVVFATKEVVPYKDISSTDYLDWPSVPTSSNKDTYKDRCDFIGGHRMESGNVIVSPSYKSDADIIDELTRKSQFFQLSVLRTENEINFSSSRKPLPIKHNVVSTLEEQNQLSVDDYYGWNTKVVKRLDTYNSRLNFFDYERKTFKGFNIFKAICILDNEANLSKDVDYVRYHVHIVSDKTDSWVKSSNATYNCFDPNNKEFFINSKRLFADWFYYPDPNATEVFIEYKKNDEDNPRYAHFQLAVHPMLNGSYCFLGLPSRWNKSNLLDDIYHPDMGNTTPNYNGSEKFDSQIITSVVNNPFVFEASGDNTVGTGKILGVAANTEAVSQGQHGYAPLIVFTTEGMYALKTNSEGLYVGVDPLPREVCNNADSITPIDNYVIFTSDKGLMAATGGSAICLSDQMRGRAPRNFASMGGGRFLDFLKDCFIAYDYRDSLLRIFKKSKGYTKDGEVVEDEKFYYVYDLASKTFSMGKLKLPIKAVVNDYPDNLVQDVYGNIYSLTGKPDINDDETLYSGGFTTRPLKLGGSMTLKSLRAIKHLYDTDEGKVKLEVYGSNDCKNWVKLTSLGGKPWKYFTFKYTLTDFRACDSFAGTIVEVQSRREDKMR